MLSPRLRSYLDILASTKEQLDKLPKWCRRSQPTQTTSTFAYDTGDQVERAVAIEVERCEDGTMLVTGEWIGDDAKREIAKRLASVRSKGDSHGKSS